MSKPAILADGSLYSASDLGEVVLVNINAHPEFHFQSFSFFDEKEEAGSSALSFSLNSALYRIKGLSEASLTLKRISSG